MLEFYYDKDDIEAGCDEAGRGCLVGRVYAAAVIWPKEIPQEIMNIVDFTLIRDSKKLTEKRRLKAVEIIKRYSIAWAVAYEDEKTIDEINILQAAYSSMHKAIRQLHVEPQSLLVDGSYFKPYMNMEGEVVPHTTVTKGDNKYMSIAAASILAKVHRDQYITELYHSDPKFEPYEWHKNKSYGTKKHLDAIKKYGITPYHRLSFGICKKYAPDYTEDETHMLEDTSESESIDDDEYDPLDVTVI